MFYSTRNKIVPRRRTDLIMRCYQIQTWRYLKVKEKTRVNYIFFQFTSKRLIYFFFCLFDGYWSTWHQFCEGINYHPLIRVGVSVCVSVCSRHNFWTPNKVKVTHQGNGHIKVKVKMSTSLQILCNLYSLQAGGFDWNALLFINISTHHSKRTCQINCSYS